jgi:hypothetical protein
MYVIIKEETVNNEFPVFIAKLAGGGEHLFESTSLRDAALYRAKENAQAIADKVDGARVCKVLFQPQPKE